MTIRHFFLGSFCVFLIFGPHRANAVPGHTFQQWGQEILAQIEADYRLGGTTNRNLYAESLTQRFPAYAWPQGIMFGALAAAAKVDPSYLSMTSAMADAFRNRYRCNARGYWAYNATAGSCNDRYYDDNAWIAIVYMELYELTGSPDYLERAREILIFCMSGENGPGDNYAGGIRWHESNTGGVSICSTAPTILANLMVYQATGLEQYLTDGTRLYNWLTAASFLRTSSGIYHEINQGPLGYLTGVMIQSAVRLYHITGNTDYLTEAQRLAVAVGNQFIHSNTLALDQAGKWGGHDMTNAYVELYEVDHNRHWLNLATGYLDFLYQNCKSPTSGRYPERWNNTSGSASASLIDNASVARAYWKMATTLGGSAPTYPLIKNRVSGRCLRLTNSGTTDNTTLHIFDENPSWTSQMFALVDLGSGYYNIRSRHASNKSLQPLNSSSVDNTNTVIFTTHVNSYAQQWALIDVGSGYFNIQNRLTGKSLQPLNSNTSNNTSVITFATDLSRQSQQWQIVGVHVPTSITPSLSVNGRDWVQTDRVILDTGDTLTLRGQAPGNGTWIWTGPNGFTANGHEVTIPDIQVRQAGRYSVTYTNNHGVNSYAAINVSVPAALKIYQHCNYTGWVTPFGVGAYTLADLVAAGGLNNDASSIQIEPGYTVTFYDYDNFQGPTLVKTTDVLCLVSDGWNDRVTSFIVEGSPAPASAHWTFNEKTGSMAGDSSGNAHHGQFVNMDQDNWTLGKRCGGLYFNGIDNYLTIPGFKGISGGLSRTCTAWIKTTKASGDIMTWGHAASGTKWIVRINETGSLRAQVQGGFIYGITPVNDGQWHHIAVVLENDDTPNISEVVLYVNGRPDVPEAILSHPINTADTLDVALGVDPLVGTRYFQGRMDEVRVYSRALSNTEVWHLYAADALAGDILSDGVVDIADFLYLAETWLSSHDGAADLTCDGIVDLADFAILAEEWLRSL